MTACTSAHINNKNNNEYPVPIQCLTQRHRYASSLDWEDFASVVAEPINFIPKKPKEKRHAHKRCGSAPGSLLLSPLPLSVADRAYRSSSHHYCQPVAIQRKTRAPPLLPVVHDVVVNRRCKIPVVTSPDDRRQQDQGQHNMNFYTNHNVIDDPTITGTTKGTMAILSALSRWTSKQVDNNNNSHAAAAPAPTITRRPDSAMMCFETNNAPLSATNPTDESHHCHGPEDHNFTSLSSISTSSSSCHYNYQQQREGREQGHEHDHDASTLMTSITSTTATSTATSNESPCINETSTSTSSMTTTTPSPVIQTLVQGVVHAVESVQEQRRKASSRKRISQALLTLRAATLLHNQQVQARQKKQQRVPNNDDDDDDNSYYDYDYDGDDDDALDLSELGSVLFCPLEPPVRLHHHHRNNNNNSDLHHHISSARRIISSNVSNSTKIQIQGRQQDSSSSTTTTPIAIVTPASTPEKDHFTDDDGGGDIIQTNNNDLPEKIPVLILPEPGNLPPSSAAAANYDDNDNPRLLTQEMFQQLVDDGIPECLQLNAWKRIYSIGRDGDSFQTFLLHCANYKHTILVLQTTTGHLLGGFVSDSWKEQEGFTKKHSYYGNGVSFLFANHPARQQPQQQSLLDDDDDNPTTTTTNNNKPLSIYPWTGSNDFCQICDKDKSILAMGGSGAFGFILEDDFYKGSTDCCATFGNPPLTPDKDGIFTVAAMEVYGLVPYGLLDNQQQQRRHHHVAQDDNKKAHRHNIIIPSVV